MFKQFKFITIPPINNKHNQNVLRFFQNHLVNIDKKLEKHGSIEFLNPIHTKFVIKFEYDANK